MTVFFFSFLLVTPYPKLELLFSGKPVDLGKKKKKIRISNMKQVCMNIDLKRPFTADKPVRLCLGIF